MIEPRLRPDAYEQPAVPADRLVASARLLRTLALVVVGEVAALTAVVWFAGFATLPRASMLPVRIAFIVLGHVFMVLGFRFRKALRHGKPFRGRPGIAAVTARTMMMLATVEAILMLGFVLRVLGGAWFDFLAFCVWTLTLLATFFPREDRVRAWVAASEETPAAPPF